MKLFFILYLSNLTGRQHDQSEQDVTLIMVLIDMIFGSVFMYVQVGMGVCVFLYPVWAESCLFVVAAAVATLNLLGTGGFMVMA